MQSEREEMGWCKMEKPEEERSPLLTCLPPVGNISKWSGTKVPRTCSRQNLPKGDFFQSRLAASELLFNLKQQSSCQKIKSGLSLLCHQPAEKLYCFAGPSLSSYLSLPLTKATPLPPGVSWFELELK